MKFLVVLLVFVSIFVEALGHKTSSLSSDLMTVNEIYQEIDSLKSSSAQNKLYIDSFDGVFYPLFSLIAQITQVKKH